MSAPVVNLCKIQRRPGPPLPALHRLARSKVGVVLLVLTLMAPGLLPFLLFVPPLVLVSTLGVVSHYYERRFMDLCIASWLNYVTIIFERVLGIRTRIFGFHGRFKKRCVFIMNHVSHLDWLYFWTVARELGDLSIWKVITKDNIRNAPLFGPSMQCGCLLFIKRSWDKDEAEFRDKLDYFNAINYPCQLLLFPEGGDLNYKSKERSDTYADEHKLPHYKYCIHPRTKGFTYIISKLRECGLDAVYDLTIAFPDTLPKTEVDFVSGMMPRTIDFHVKSYSDSDIPLDEKGLGEWCQERWAEKEQLLHSYYTNGTFREDTVTTPTTQLNNGVNLRSSKRTESTLNDSKGWSQLALLLWLFTLNFIPSFLLYVTWGVFGSALFIIYMVLSLVFMLWMSLYSIGFDKLWLLIQRKNTMKYLASRGREK